MKRAKSSKGRKKPYTEIGISRIPCLRCGKPSSHQWQICCLDNNYYGICTVCDIALNDLVLVFMGFNLKNRIGIINRYKEKK